MRYGYTIQCQHPESGKTGCWLYSGNDHRQGGTAISPVFSDLYDLFRWMMANGWETFGTLEARKAREEMVTT